VKQIYPLHPPPDKSRPIFVPLFGGLLLLNLFVVGLLGLWQYQSWRQYRARAYTATENLATTLQHDILDNVGMVDITLLALAREKSLQEHEGFIDLSLYNLYFRHIQQRLPELFAVRITDAAGTIIAASDADTGGMRQTGRNLADRDYFQKARDDPKAGLIISKPLIGATSHQWTIIFARRVERADGRFDGIVYGAMILERYVNLFSGVDLGSQGVVALRDGDLNLIVRQPSVVQPDSAPGRLRPPDPLKHIVESGQTSGYYENESLVDGVKRLLFFQKVGDFPLYVAVGVGKDEVYASWRRDLYRIILAALTFVAASTTVTGMFWRSWCRQAEISERALEANRQLQASVATLRERDEDLRATQEVARLGVYSLDYGSDLFVGSDELRDIYGLEPDEPLSVTRWLDIMHPEDRVVMENIAARTPGMTQLNVQYRVIRPKDGRTIWLQVVGKIERDENDKPVRVRGAVQDITQRCLAEQHIQSLNEELEHRVQQRTAQLESLNQDLIRARDLANAGARAKADFLANMSHEIRTPMNAVIGFTHLALATDLTARQRDYVDKIMTAARSLLRLINDVLDFSKIDAGKLTLEQVPFSLDSVLTEVSDILAVQVSEKPLEMRFDTGGDVPPTLIGDAARLHQVLLNLLSNAVKFTERGTVRLSVAQAARTGDAVTLRFEVQDSGIGLSEDQQRRLFTPFDQADSSITRRYGGTGLGLAIARRLVALMGGEIGVESVLGRGARFWFTAGFGVSAVPAVPPVRRKRKAVNLAGARVLVVEDNEINRLVTKDMLEQAGIEARFAENGVEGVRAVLEDGPFDGVLMDVQMPRMDGYTATRLIRANPGYAELPIIALTANALQGDRDAALAAGMNDYIAKPVDPEAALETLGRWIRPAAPAATGPEGGVLDRTAGLRRVGGNKALYDKILRRFTEDAGQFAATFRTVYEAGDGEAATRLAHSLKSSAGTIGADDVQRAAARLEEFCRTQPESEAVSAPLDTLDSAIGRLLSELALVPEEPLGR
jgi:PAS domain S-box-containing protein